MSDLPVVRWALPITPAARMLVVALHGRGADETAMDFVADLVGPGVAVASPRAPLAEGAGFAWFANRGIGRPVPESLAASIGLLTGWLDTQPAIPIVLVGFSGGMAMAGGMLLADPRRYAGAVLLSGTLPFDAELPTVPGRLDGLPVLLARGQVDAVIPADLVARTLTYLEQESGAVLTSRSYPGLGHVIDERMAQDVQDWLARQGSAG